MNTENAETTAPTEATAQHDRINWIAYTIVGAVEAAPMGFCYDGGERATALAGRIDRKAQHESRQRVTKVLTDLRAVLATSREQAAEAAIGARKLGDTHAGDYNEGRAHAFLDAMLAVNHARAAILGITPGNTRQENAQAFAEAIINGGTQ